jgi:hypothetical protein
MILIAAATAADRLISGWLGRAIDFPSCTGRRAGLRRKAHRGLKDPKANAVMPTRH